MRNLQECQAEVFRRSEKRIRQRKQRRSRMLMAAIPLVLCITVLSAAFLPDGKANSAAPMEGIMDEATEVPYENGAPLAATVTVSGVDFSRVYTEDAQVLRISQRLKACMAGEPENGVPAQGAFRGEDPKKSGGQMADSATAGYTIMLVTPEGEMTEYYLAGNTLKELAANKTCTLSANQEKELKALLGIPQP